MIVAVGRRPPVGGAAASDGRYNGCSSLIGTLGESRMQK
jgi:hypothetical protein